jgi:hypothetical protein
MYLYLQPPVGTDAEVLGGIKVHPQYLFNPILHMWLRDSCFTCDGSSTIQLFPVLFNIGMVN